MITLGSRLEFSTVHERQPAHQWQPAFDEAIPRLALMHDNSRIRKQARQRPVPVKTADQHHRLVPDPDIAHLRHRQSAAAGQLQRARFRSGNVKDITSGGKFRQP